MLEILHQNYSSAISFHEIRLVKRYKQYILCDCLRTTCVVYIENMRSKGRNRLVTSAVLSPLVC